jgi:7-cyano-7-deazaguanine synthase in queuosine biosynthesis
MMLQRFPFSVSFWNGSRTNTTELRLGRDFRFDFESVHSFCLEELPARLVDFLRIATAIYVVDRLARRRTAQGTKRPSRTIGMQVEILAADFWCDPRVRDAVHETVEFVSGDFWNVEFVADKARYTRHCRFLPDQENESPLVCLYSGGLDSVAGLAARIKQCPARPVIPVTVWHQPRQRHLVRQQMKLFRRQFDTPVDPLIAKVAMNWSSKVDRSRQERSQRCRSFLFAALGAIAAILNGQQIVEVFESGIGAINLPLMAGMIGSKTTKSAHPKFLRLISRLASLVAEIDIEFSLPFMPLTKGELVRSLRGSGLEELANRSASCIHFPQRHCKQKQCGVCPACIFRRQALASAGITEPNDAYEYDFLGSARAANAIPPRRLQFLKAFLMQVALLKDIETTVRLPPALSRYLISTEILGRNQSQEDVIELLKHYRDEWMAIASDRAQHGHNWARLLDLQALKVEGVTNATA